MLRSLLSTCLALAVVAPASAENLAVIIANSDYDTYEDVRDAVRIAGLVDDFEGAGFRVQIVQNSGRNVTAQQAETLLSQLQAAERVAIVLSGHIVSTAQQNWLLHSDARQTTALTIGQDAVPIEPFLAVAGQRPGNAFVMLAESPSAIPLGVGVDNRSKFDDVPQGVTLVHGPTAPMALFIENGLLQPGTTTVAAVGQAPQVISVSGFVSPNTGLVAAEFSAPAPTNPRVTEADVWRAVRAEDSVVGYDRYLRQFPRGRFAAEAQRRKAILSQTPQDRARIAEEQLNLSRDQRRAIQRQLTLLGFNTRGIDGVFGRNTRSAIANWQTSVGNLKTGYLTANQINRIEASAAVRAEELRREAELRRQEAERQDRNFWSQTGAGGTEDGLQAYLQRYPDGLFSSDARRQLKRIERDRRRQAEAAERQAWDGAVMAGTIGSYQDYLRVYPRGLFAAEARARIQALQSPETPPDVIAAARQEETRLGLNQITRRLIERQLRNANLDPGPVDGKFTAKTRRALRQYQRATNQPVTGYVTQNTVVTLLASAIK